MSHKKRIYPPPADPDAAGYPRRGDIDAAFAEIGFYPDPDLRRALHPPPPGIGGDSPMAECGQ